MPLRFQPICVTLVILAGCTSSTGDLCDEEGDDPIVVTGLSGLLDGATPTVEIVQLIPGTCEERDSIWMFWDDSTEVASLGPEPTSGILSREDVEVTDETIFFRELNVGVRLDYLDGIVGPELALAWFSTGTDLAAVDCSAAPVLTCAIRE